MRLWSNYSYLPVGMVPTGAISLCFPGNDGKWYARPKEGVPFTTPIDGVIRGGWGQGWKAPDVPVKAGTTITLLCQGDPANEAHWQID